MSIAIQISSLFEGLVNEKLEERDKQNARKYFESLVN